MQNKACFAGEKGNVCRMQNKASGEREVVKKREEKEKEKGQSNKPGLSTR
jgi:hypothetical protein